MASQDWFDKDFYAILGVSKDASDADIKKAYRKLARKYHPDQNPGDAASEAKFKEISEAHSVLADAEERKEYDAVRAMGSGARFTAPGGAGAGGFEDVFGTMFGGPGGRGGQRYTYQQGEYDDLLGGLFGGGRFGQTTGGYRGFGGPTKGRDVTASTTLDFITATKGDRITLQTSDGREITVNVPAGVADGQKIRLRGKGHPSPDGGEPGDIVLTVRVRKHPVFERDGLNLRVNVPVTFAEAALGAQVEVPTLEGRVKLTVPPGSPDGRALRLAGKGAPRLKGGGRGDLIATLRLDVPRELSDTQRDALEKFAKLDPRDPRETLFS
jgi:molecular chaperone DnaJ